MTALTYAALARATQANPSDGLFADLAAKIFPADTVIVHSSGHSSLGVGAGSYISDSLATAQLVADHPRFAFTDAGGRHFRLLPNRDAITVEQGGARGLAGINDQPAIQDAIDYAGAVGIGTIGFSKAHYELWAPIRISPASDHAAPDGHFLVVSNTLALRGVSGERTVLDCLSESGRSPETNWQDVGGSVWRGNGIYIRGDTSAAAPAQLPVERIELERLVFRGNTSRTENNNFPANPVTGDGWDITHKGFRIQDSHVGDIIMRDTEFVGWKGEMFYVVGYAPRSIHAERCRMLTGNANAWNPQVSCPTTVIDCEFGDCFQAAEALSQGGATYRNTLFRDCDRLWFVGGESPLVGYHYRWAHRDEGGTETICRFDGCEFRNVNEALVGSYVRGKLKTVDTMVLMDCSTLFAVEDTSLKIDAWLDQTNGTPPVVLTGPGALNEQVPSSPAGTYRLPIRNVHVSLSCFRTRLATAQSRHWGAPQWNGHVEPNCSILIGYGEFALDGPVRTYNNPPISFPLVAHRNPITTQFFGAPNSLWHGSVGANGEFVPRSALCATGVDTESTFDLHLPIAPAAGTNFGYAEGQVIRIYKRGNTGGLRFVRDGHASFVVPQTRVLDNDFDWIDFRWNIHAGRWEEGAFWSSAAS